MTDDTAFMLLLVGAAGRQVDRLQVLVDKAKAAEAAEIAERTRYHVKPDETDPIGKMWKHRWLIEWELREAKALLRDFVALADRPYGISPPAA